MLPITSFPRRFVTSSKRVLSLLPTHGLFIDRSHVISIATYSTTNENTLTNVVNAFNAKASTSTVHVTTISDQPKRKDDLYGKRSDEWWSGKNPNYDRIPGKLPNNTLTSIALPNLATCTRQNVLDYFDNTWALTEILFSSLQGEDAFTTPPFHHLRHPLIFYYGHTVAFYVNKLRVAGIINETIDPYFERVFEVGVDEMSWDDMSKNTMKWPRVSEVTKYRRKVYNLVKGIIMTHPELAADHAPITRDSQLWALFMCFEHERIHIETSSVLMRELPLKYLKKPEYWADYHPSAYNKSKSTPQLGVDFPQNEWLHHAGGAVTIGKPQNFPTYGWDNEYGNRRINVKSFKGSKYMVTNGEFWNFVADGGYHNSKYWTKNGWEWRAFRNAKWPTFWIQDGPAGLHQYKYRAIFDEIAMPWSWPVDVNYHEASAYAKWLQEKEGSEQPYHLTTEAIHQLLQDKDDQQQDPIMHVIGRMTDSHAMNLNLSYSSSSPVNEFKPTKSGYHDLFGNSWEWCEDHFSALSGFQIHPYYDDFSTPCFDGEHHIIKGGSFMSTGDNGGSIFCRYHFRPHFHQHAGFRLFSPLSSEEHIQTTCLDAPGPYAKPNPFRSSKKSGEDDREKDSKIVVAQYLASHYGMNDKIARDMLINMNFQENCASLVSKMMKQHVETRSKVSKALDIGCAVGRATFELARNFDQVIGLDNNPLLIEVAQSLKDNGFVSYDLSEFGWQRECAAAVDRNIDRSRVSWKLADAMCIPPELHGFDAVLAANLIENVASPAGILARMGGYGGIVAPGGILVLTSSYKWDTNITPKGAWLGGSKDGAGNDTSSVGSIGAALGSEFQLVGEDNIPSWHFVRPRNYDVCISHVTVWKRNTNSAEEDKKSSH